MDIVIGASGQVGWQIYSQLKEKGENVLGTYYNYYVQGLQSMPGYLSDFLDKNYPTTVYLVGGKTNVDECEGVKFSEDAPLDLIDAVLKTNRDAKFVYFSSDYVFDGKMGHTNGYREDHLVCPINNYGKQKVAVEHYLLVKAKDPLIIRTCGVFGPDLQKKNFVYRIKSSKIGIGAMFSEPMLVPIDQWGTPTYSPDLASKTIKLVQMNASGIFNITGGILFNRYEFAIQIAKAFNLPTDKIWGVTTETLNQKASRPERGGLTVGKVEKFLGEKVINPVEGLNLMKASLL